jgi:hypothetical protein
MNNIHYLKDVIIEHEHYACNKVVKDDMYNELNSAKMNEQDRESFFNIIKSIEFNNKLQELKSNKFNN